MPVEFKLPVLAENVETVTVTRILVSVGETVRVDQPVIEIETDKAAAEVPSSLAGTVTEIRAKEGEPLRVGDVVMIVSGDGEAKSAPPAAAPAQKPAAATPRLAMTTPVLVAATPEPEREIEGPVAPPGPAPITAKPPPRPGGIPVPASPSVRRLAREIGVDISQVPGSGPDGRISMEDVKTYSRQVNTDVRGVSARSSDAPMAPPDLSRWGEVERQPMNSVRRRTAENMTVAWTTVPHVTQFDKADITQVEALRKEHGKRVEADGAKLTITAILVKVLAAALKKFPRFNASVDMRNNEIILRKYYNIGVAVDTDRGLLVPVIHNVDEKNILGIAVEMQGLAERARQRKSRLDEMQGGTFTVSNLGGIGGTAFTPIINPPEVAILGVSSARVEPVYVDGRFEPRTMLPLSLSYDHRIIDGADAARFLRWVCQALEQPFLLFLEA